MGAETVTVTRNETMTALSKPAETVLRTLEIEDGHPPEPRYARRRSQKTPGVGGTDVTYKLDPLLQHAEVPR